MDPLSETAADEPEEAPDARIGRLVDERYKILEAMASGSMGAVYKAERVPVGKLVAIKFLHASFAKDSEFLARFERETRVMSKLTHPNCVSVVDFGFWEGAPYLVMEYVAGITLRALIDQAAIPPPRALLLARQIAAGLAHAHAQGIVHRDVKPANIMISEEIGTGDHVRILDFGLARLRGAVGRDATQSNVVVGTPNYMAPEQTIGGGTIDARTDVYAVGIVLFEMVAGERPFQAEDTMSLLGMHRAAPIPSLVDRASPGLVLPDGLQDVIEKAMAKSPGDRFQSAIELAGAIDEVTGGRGEHRIPVHRKTDPAAMALAPTVVDPNKNGALVQPRQRSDHDKPPSWFGAFVLVMILLGGAAAAVWYLKFRGGSSAGNDSAVVAIGSGSESGSDKVGSPAGGRAVMGGPDSAAPLAVGSGSNGSDAAGSGSAIGFGSGIAVPLDATTADMLGSGSSIAIGPGAGSGEGSGSGEEAGSGSGSGSGSAVAPPEEINMDPATVEDPNPTQTTAEDEAPDAPETPEDVDKRAPAVPVVATTLADAVQLIKEGKRDRALASLRALWKKAPASSYIPFLLGNLYNDRLWWAVALDHYKAAIAKNGRYKSNPTLNRNVIRMLASTKTQRKASSFLRWTIGKPAVPYLRAAAARDANTNIRRQAAVIARAIR